MHRGRLFLPETSSGVNKGIAYNRAAALASILSHDHFACLHFACGHFAPNRGYFWRSMLSEENHSPILGF
jgi:hypothetical protein